MYVCNYHPDIIIGMVFKLIFRPKNSKPISRPKNIDEGDDDDKNEVEDEEGEDDASGE